MLTQTASRPMKIKEFDKFRSGGGLGHFFSKCPTSHPPSLVRRPPPCNVPLVQTSGTFSVLGSTRQNQIAWETNELNTPTQTPFHYAPAAISTGFSDSAIPVSGQVRKRPSHRSGARLDP